MDQGADAPGLGESQNPSPSSSSSSSSAVAADTLVPTKQSEDIANPLPPAQQSAAAAAAVAVAGAAAAAAAAAASSSQPLPPSRYESQKRRDWNSFLQYLKNHKPSLALSRCSGAHVIEFLKYLDQFGKTKVHAQGCTYFGHPSPPAPCACPLRQAWGSLDALIGRLRAAYEENGGSPDSNLFGANAVRIYLREVRESQEKARGIPYEKKKRKRQTMIMGRTAKESAGSSSAAAAFTEAAADDESSKKAAAAATGALASSEETTKEGEGSDTVPQQGYDLT